MQYWLLVTRSCISVQYIHSGELECGGGSRGSTCWCKCTKGHWISFSGRNHSHQIIKVPKSMKLFKTPDMLSCEDLKTGAPASKHCQRNKATYAFWYHQRPQQIIEKQSWINKPFFQTYMASEVGMYLQLLCWTKILITLPWQQFVNINATRFSWRPG